MPCSAKFYELLGLIDPYKEFVQMERSRALLVLRTFMLSFGVIGFIAYSAFAVLSFVTTPEPSDLSVTRIFPSKPPQALLQFSFGIPLDGSSSDPMYPTRYTSPFSTTLTLNNVTSYKASSRVPTFLNIPGNTFAYEIYTFPVYGTLDANTLTSTILYFEPPKYTNVYNFPILFFVGPPSTAKYSNLEVTYHSPRDYRVSQPGNPTEFTLIYGDFNDKGPEIAISLVLSKFVTSNDDVTYNASIFGLPSLSADTRVQVVLYPAPMVLKQRTISVTIDPIVNVINQSPKNILSFVGSIAGIFPLFLSIGGILCSIIWSQLGRQNTGSSNEEGPKVLMNAIKGTPA